jgi:hypothetical protein
MAIGVVIGVSGRVLAEFPAFVEWHRVSFFPWLTRALQTVSGSFDGPIGEIGWVIVIAAALFGLLGFGSRAVAPLVLVTGIAVALFYAAWGIAYQYEPLGRRLSPMRADRANEEAEKARLVDLTRRSALLLARASAAAPDLPEDDVSSLARISAGLTAGFERIPAEIEAAPVKAVRFGAAKFSRVSFAMSRLLISGYFSPWTGEAQIDREMPRSLWPRVAAHEKAHQRGFARENEATAIGVLACLESPDPQVFYGGALGLFVALDREVDRVDRDARKAIWKLLPPRAVEQLETESAFWKSHEGRASDVSEKVNDTYLKAQGVASGVGSYGEAARLLLQAVETKTLNLGALLDSVEPPIREN